MNLYTLDENFIRQAVVDDFTSVVWTERYTKAGDISLLVPLTRENITKLPEGIFVGTPVSKEVMLIESALQEKDQLKLTGNTLLKFLDERIIRASANHEDRYYNITTSPGMAMAQLVQDMAINSVYLNSSAYGFDGPRQKIPNLTIASVDATLPSVALAVPYGPLYSALAQIAETYQVGQSLYLDSASASGYSLKFKTYMGRNRTSGQSSVGVVRFSPNVDSLTNIKELRSISGYKNVAYAFAPSNPIPGVVQPGVAYADPQAAASVGFRRRVLMVSADDITTDKVGGVAATLIAMLNQRAKDALANNNYTRVVDGEVVPQSEYKFGVDYNMGDIVELQGLSGYLQKAQITEYIRTQDSTGERAYPTISVIE